MKAKEIMRSVIGPDWVDTHSSWTVDCLKIGDPDKDGTSVAIRADNHRLILLEDAPKVGFSEMQFESYETARALFDGKINAVAAVGTGKVRIFGMISQIDNVNRILDRVSIYLA